jgi:transcriptional regulator with XRE-family HTH domain
MNSRGKRQASIRHADAEADAVADLAARISELGDAVVGERVHALRLQQAVSVRELAERAGISKNSVTRLEQGRGSHARTVLRVCEALGTHASRVLADRLSPRTVEVHRREDDRWHDLRVQGGAPLPNPAVLNSARRRQYAARVGAPGCIAMLRSVLPDGLVFPGVMELVGPTPLRRHPGEEFVYVLSGKAIVEIAGTEWTLREGEAITFRSGEAHRYRPAPRQRGVVRLLAVRVNSRAEPTR